MIISNTLVLLMIGDLLFAVLFWPLHLIIEILLWFPCLWFLHHWCLDVGHYLTEFLLIEQVFWFDSLQIHILIDCSELFQAFYRLGLHIWWSDYIIIQSISADLDDWLFHPLKVIRFLIYLLAIKWGTQPPRVICRSTSTVQTI